MDNLKFNERLSTGQDVYVRDGEVKVHVLSDEERTTFIKRKRKEFKVPYSNKTAFKVILLGQEILKEEY